MGHLTGELEKEDPKGDTRASDTEAIFPTPSSKESTQSPQQLPSWNEEV